MIDCYCPYCFVGLDIAEICPDGHLDRADSYDMKCPNCAKDIEIEVEKNPVYYANKIEYHECMECNKDFRLEYDLIIPPKKYADIAPFDVMLCNNCYWKLFYEDMYGENWKGDANVKTCTI